MHVNKLTSLGYGVVISLVNWHAGQESRMLICGSANQLP